MISLLEIWESVTERGKPSVSATAKTAMSDGTTFWWNNRRAHPLLDAAEEKKLARQIKKGAPHEREAARKRLIECNLRLVWVHALSFYQHKPSSLCLGDLFQEGCIGLMRATERFDPKRGFRFSTCATPWIRQFIAHAIQAQEGAIHIPAHVHAQRHHALCAAQQLTQILGRQPSPTELAAHLPSRLQSSLETHWDVISLDTLAYEDSQNETLADTLPDLSKAQDYINHMASQSDLRGHIEGLLEQLPPRSARVLCLRYGLAGETEHNYREIGLLLDLHPETIRQIEKSAVRRLSQSPVLQEWVAD